MNNTTTERIIDPTDQTAQEPPPYANKVVPARPVNDAGKHVIGARSAETERLVRLLASVKVGEVVTYKQLGNAIGFDDIRRDRSRLYSALRIVIAEHQIVFGCVSNEGMKRLDDGEISGLGEDATQRIRRVSQRTVKAIKCAEYEKLSNADKIKSNTTLSFFGTLIQMTRRSSVLKLEDHCRQAMARIGWKGTLSIFAKNGESVTE